MNEIEKSYAVVVDKLSFAYLPGKTFIKNLSISLKEGKYICVVGHNGSGKTTFSRLLTGLLRPQSGSIHIFNKSISSLSYQQLFSSLGVVFQNPDSQFITSSAEEELAFGLENKKVPKKYMVQIISELLEALNLKDLKDKSPTTLSGGQKQKVAIASILAFNPSIFVFDESSSLLSPIEKKEIVSLMKRLVEEYKKTVISITHDMEELLLADEIIVFSGGKLVRHIKCREELFSLPYSFFRDLSLIPPFVVYLGYILREKYGFNLLPYSSEDDLVKGIGRLMGERN
ncbi:hypothetical protein PVNG_02467 [Plasmodium vivax North Korean]|uniref:ABC transporter domain-containing protein n=1 Tax=Plasmodium vivax North Korean TaxID=1035514 RepID=A0A0J9TLZ1_PLAVI|nr:hypothetical protein PVNG_02467 [Plasmodium vivax North Korean]